jgi:hypothetical protein
MRTRVVGLSIGALAFTGACATSPAATERSSILEVAPAPQGQQRSAKARGLFDSLYAQTIADREGPRVDIRAQVSQLASTRRLRAVFDVEDDAYVMVGHVDAAGVLRIVFPADPGDDGFVQGGGRSYQTAEFFGGFSDQYRFRYSNYGRYSGTRPQAYDGRGGYLFIVASWRPMRAEQFSHDGRWDSFEVTSEAYVRDPRPAIYELASVLAGETREEYTVKFASYFNSQNVSPFASYSGYSAFGLGLCSASYFGWGGSIPWSYLSTNAPFLTSGFAGAETFSYRGRRYAYDSLGDCAVPLPYGYSRYGYPRIASLPVVPGKPTNPIAGRTRMLSAGDSPRNPFDPQPKGGRVAPGTARDGGAASQGAQVHISSEYRHRGLITEDRPEVGVSRSAPRISGEDRSRPSVEQMTERRTRNIHEGTGSTRSRLDTDDAPRRPSDRSRAVDRARDRSTQEPTRRSGSTRAAPAPERRTERPIERRTERPTERRTEPRSAPPRRTAEPRSSEPRSTPASKTRTPPSPARSTPSR